MNARMLLLPSARLLRLSALLAASALTALVQAQTPAAPDDVDAERARLQAERRSVEATAAEEQKGCYQRFVVESCLRDSRSRRRAAIESIQKQESAINDAERQRRSAEATQRTEERRAGAPDAAARQRNVDAQRAREAQSAEREADRARRAAEAEANRQAFEDKQRANAQVRQRAAERRADAPTEREKFEAKQRRAEERRQQAARRAAENDKPPAAPLPDPPPVPAKP